MPVEVDSVAPCAICKLLGWECTPDCLFAPHFTAVDEDKLKPLVHVFGVPNVIRMLQEVLPEQRADAVSSLLYEAEGRSRDPVYGCVAAISALQDQVARLQVQLAQTHAQVLFADLQQRNQDDCEVPEKLHKRARRCQQQPHVFPEGSSNSPARVESMKLELDQIAMVPHGLHPVSLAAARQRWLCQPSDTSSVDAVLALEVAGNDDVIEDSDPMSTPLVPLGSPDVLTSHSSRPSVFPIHFSDLQCK